MNGGVGGGGGGGVVSRSTLRMRRGAVCRDRAVHDLIELRQGPSSTVNLATPLSVRFRHLLNVWRWQFSSLAIIAHL